MHGEHDNLCKIKLKPCFFFRKMKAFTETITDILVVTNQVLLFVLLVLLCYYPKHIFGFQKSVQILF